ncbi:MAG: radical SAM protein [Clostridia bacterium]|nr:radical SAM protein [Clostridia bacterium]
MYYYLIVHLSLKGVINLFDKLKACTICPRKCGVNRIDGKLGYCRTNADLIVSRASLHQWEEPCISGKNGSGTVFFSGCSLGCVYCQNHLITKAESGKKISVERLCEIFFELKEKGAHNINLVTPTHFALHIIKAIKLAKTKGLNLPIVYNTSGYESVSTLKMLDGLIDVYLPDFKYLSSDIAKEFSFAEDYPEIAKTAIAEMYRQTGKFEVSDDGMIKKGVIVRHLVLPGYVDESKKVIKYLYDNFSDNIFISIMNQYTPMPAMKNHPNLHRKLTTFEYEKVIDYALSLGVENAFIQDKNTAKESFIPDFNCEGI